MIPVMAVNVQTDLNSSNLFITLVSNLSLSPQHPCEQISGWKVDAFELVLDTWKSCFSIIHQPGDEGSEINGPSSQKSGSAQSGNEVVFISLALGAPNLFHLHAAWRASILHFAAVAYMRVICVLILSATSSALSECKKAAAVVAGRLFLIEQ